jgi:hypothetical protein
MPLADAAAIDNFYRAVASTSLTLLGLWWVVVSARYKEGEGDPRRRRHAYGVALFFLLPGLMSLISSINSDLTTLWRLAFGICGAAGIAELVLFLLAGGTPTLAAMALRLAGLVVYVLIVAFALWPDLVDSLGLGLTPREAEAVLLGLLLLVGANLAWLGLIEPGERAGA